MRVSFKKLQFVLDNNTNNNNSNVLKIKSALLGMIKKGDVFIDRSVSELTEDSNFQFYHSVRASDKSNINAFPVPVDKLQLHKNEEEQYLYLKSYFESYYNYTRLSKEEFYQYTRKPFVGENYAWFYKKIA